jgi:hypothetical protein
MRSTVQVFGTLSVTVTPALIAFEMYVLRTPHALSAVVWVVSSISAAFISLQTFSHLASTAADALLSAVTAFVYDAMLAFADAPRLSHDCCACCCTAAAAEHPPFVNAAAATAVARSRPGK